MAANYNFNYILSGGGASKNYIDATETISAYGFSFEPNAAYDAYKLVSSLSEKLVELINSLNTSQELVIEIDKHLDLYNASIRMLIEYSDYITPFLTGFQDCMSKISTIDPSFGMAFNLLMMSDGEIDLELLENKTYKELEQMNSEYFMLCEFADKVGLEDAKNFYSFEDLKSNNESLYYRFMEYFSIQCWSTNYGFKYGEFPCDSYSEFKKAENIKSNNRVLSYYTFSHEMPSLELFSFETGFASGKHDVSELQEYETLEFIKWSTWRSDDIMPQVNALGFSISSSYEARNAIYNLDKQVDELWNLVFEYKVSDVGTACINFMQDGYYSRKTKYFDDDADNYLVGFIYVNSDGRKDFTFAAGSLDVLHDVDPTTVQEVYLSDYADEEFYKKFRTAYMNEDGFRENWKNTELYLEADEMSKTREANLAIATENFSRENEKLTNLQVLNTLVNDTAYANLDTVYTSWRPDFAERSMPIDIFSDVEKIKTNFVYNYNSCNGILQISSDDELADVLYAIISGNGSFEIDSSSLYYYNSDGGIVNVYSNDSILSNYVLWYSYLTDAEKSAFYYKYSYSKSEALEYLESLSEMLNNRYVLDRKTKDEKFATENPFLASAYSVFVTPFEGTYAFLYSVSSLIRDEKIYTSHTYSTANIYRQTVASNIAAQEKPLSDVWSFLYSTGMSMADSALLLVADVATGGSSAALRLLLSASLMGSRAYVSTLNDALDRGLTDGQAVGLAFASAAAESVCESISVGKLLDLDNTLNAVLGNRLANIDNKLTHSICKVLGGAIIQGISEGQEEVCTEILNSLLDSLIAGDLSHFELAVQDKIAQGYSESEAIAEAARENFEQIMLAFLGGFISGGVNGGVFTSFDTIHSESDISKISNDIVNMYKDSTVNDDIKSFQSNLRTGNYVEAFNSVLSFESVDLATKLLASNVLYESLTNTGSLDSSQITDINNIINDGLNQFTGLSQNQQLEQFNKLSLDNQVSLLNMLNSNCSSLFNSLSTEMQQNLLNNDGLNILTKLSILYSLDTNSQSLLLNGVDLSTFVVNNSSDIIDAQVKSIDSSILSIVSDLKSMLFHDNIQLVNDVNIKKFDSLLAKALENPMEIATLISTYSSNVLDLNSSNNTYNELMEALSSKINDRYNLIHSSELANALVNTSKVDFNTALASLIVPSNIYSQLGHTFNNNSDLQTEFNNANDVAGASDSTLFDITNLTQLFESIKSMDLNMLSLSNEQVNSLFDGITDSTVKYEMQKQFMDAVLAKMINGEVLNSSTYDAIFNSEIFAGDSDFSRQYLYDTLVSMGSVELANTVANIYESARLSVNENPNMSNLYSYCDHTEAHVLQVAFLSMSTLNKINQSVNAGNTGAANYSSSLDYKTIFIAGLAHDLGMGAGIFDSSGNPINPAVNSYLVKDANGNVHIQSDLIVDGKDVADIVRGNHTLNSALAVLQNRSLFEQIGVNPDLVALLCFSHSKSNSGVVELISPQDWSFSVEKIMDAVNTYNEQFGNANSTPITFDISSLGTVTDTKVTTSPQKLLDKTTGIYTTNSFDFVGDLLTELSSMGLALRIGDAYVNKAKGHLPDGKTLSWTYNGQLYVADTLVLTQAGVYMAYDPTQAEYFNNGLTNNEATEASRYGAFMYFTKDADGNFVPWNPNNTDAKYEQDADGSYVITDQNSDCLMGKMGATKVEVVLANGSIGKFVVLDNGYYEKDGNYYEIDIDSNGNVVVTEITEDMAGYDVISQGNPIITTTGQFLAGESNVSYDFEVVLVEQIDGSIQSVLKSVYKIGDITLFPFNSIEKGIAERVGEIATAGKINRAVDVVINQEQFNKYFEVVDGKVVAKIIDGEINYGQIYINEIYSISNKSRNASINFTINGFEIHSDFAINNVINDLVNNNLTTKVSEILSGLNDDTFIGVMLKLNELSKLDPSNYSDIFNFVVNNIDFNSDISAKIYKYMQRSGLSIDTIKLLDLKLLLQNIDLLEFNGIGVHEFSIIAKCLGYDDVAIAAYINQIKEDINYDFVASWQKDSNILNFVNNMYKNQSDLAIEITGYTLDEWNEFSDTEKQEILDTKKMLDKLIECKMSRSFTDSLETLGQTLLRESEGAFTVSASDVIIARMNAKKGKYTPSKKVEINGKEYTDLFPRCDEFYTDAYLYKITRDMLRITDADIRNYCKSIGMNSENDLELLAFYLEDHKAKGLDLYVTGTIYQDATVGANNLVKFGGIGRPEVDGFDNLVYNNSGGAYVLLSTDTEMETRFGECCYIKNNQLIITNMNDFGEKALSGVPLNGANGAYKITVKIPISQCSLPSVNNAGMFTDFGVPGGYLASGAMETVISNFDISKHLMYLGNDEKGRPMYKWNGDFSGQTSNGIIYNVEMIMEGV